MDNQAYYQKKEQTAKRNRFQEYKTSKFASSISIAFGLILLTGSFDFKTKEFSLALVVAASVYLLSGIIQSFVTRKITKDILKENKLCASTRKLGFLLLPFVITGNIFIAITGFYLIKEKKNIEYNLCIYMILNVIAILLISSLNLFKDYVADYFMVGMGILIALLVFYIFTMFMVSKCVKGNCVNRKLKPLAYLLILSILTGNLFAFTLGLVILTKAKQTDTEISIEWIDVLRRLFRNYMSIIGLFVITLLLSLSICSLLTFDYATAIDNNYATLLQEPSLMYPFGTDEYGRCVFTRIVFGARISLIVGIVSTIIPIFIGGILGAFSGFYGKSTDNIIMRLLDVLYAVPGILLAIAIVAAFGATTTNLIIALSIGSIPIYARTVRATVLSISNCEFVEAARACGAKDFTIIFKHIIPNSLAPVIVRATLGIGGAVLATSSLSYLGLGVEPHIPEWGNILKLGSTYLETNPYLAIYPGLAIILIVLAFNYFGDGLRDALDPKMK